MAQMVVEQVELMVLEELVLEEEQVVAFLPTEQAVAPVVVWHL